jgi:hypothetical protein
MADERIKFAIYVMGLLIGYVMGVTERRRDG